MLNNIGEARRFYESTLPSGKFTQEDAARFFGVSIGTYAHWEQCKGKLNGEILCAIADKYGCSTDYLLCRTSDPSPYPQPRQCSTETPDESRLIDAYRKCTPRERGSIINLAETMADDGNAKNMDNRAAAEIGA